MSWTDQTEFIEQARETAARLGENWDPELEQIIKFCFDNQVFPTESGLPGDMDFLRRYVSRYYKARSGAIQPKELRTKPDPAVDWVLQAFYGVSEEACEAASDAHRRSMQAESIIGALLERYIATVLRPVGWIWCCGSTARYIDFVHPLRGEALQVKNRSNSENSASKSVRNKTKIKAWYRIEANTGRTRWEDLADSGGHLSEEGFRSFIRESAPQLNP